MPQVTEKLLEAEEKKLRVLKAEIEASKHMDKDSSKVGQKAAKCRCGSGVNDAQPLITQARELQQQEANYV